MVFVHVSNFEEVESLKSICGAAGRKLVAKLLKLADEAPKVRVL